MILRRSFLVGLFSGLIAAPAIVRASSLMPINALLIPERQLFVPRQRVLGPPRCNHCFAAWGMCGHTGGPMTEKFFADPVLDARVAFV